MLNDSMLNDSMLYNDTRSRASSMPVNMYRPNIPQPPPNMMPMYQVTPSASPVPSNSSSPYSFSYPSNQVTSSPSPSSSSSVIIAPFLKRLYEMLAIENSEILGWTLNGLSFEIRDNDSFQDQILPKYFRHNKVSSFQRQLNYFGFRKVNRMNSNVSTYTQPFFRRDEPGLMNQIKRKTKSANKHRNRSISYVQPPSAKYFTPSNQWDTRSRSFSTTSTTSSTRSASSGSIDSNNGFYMPINIKTTIESNQVLGTVFAPSEVDELLIDPLPYNPANESNDHLELLPQNEDEEENFMELQNSLAQCASFLNEMKFE